MAKWHGKIGFAEQIEYEPGKWDVQIVERPYFGDLIRNTRLLQNSSNAIDNINVGNQISIIADPYANQNLRSITYIEFMGNNWKISNVEVQYPRLILTIGGLHNNGGQA